MARGEDRLAGVTVDRDVHGDPRYVHLAKLLGLANQYEAVGRMLVLWATCTALKTDAPPLAKIVVCFGSRQAIEALIEADLAERLDANTVRVKGTSGRTEWYADLPSQQRAGGVQRAASAERGAGGKFMPKGNGAGDAGGVLVQHPPARSQQPPASLDQHPAQEPVSSARLGPDLPVEPSSSGDPDRGGPPRDRDPDPAPISRGGPRASGAAVPTVRVEPPRSAAMGPPPDPRSDERARLLRALVPRHVEIFNRVRVELGADVHGPKYVPAMQPVGDPAAVALRALLLELVELGDFEATANHVLAVREDEAVRIQSLKFLGASVWQVDNFARAKSMQVGEDRASRRTAPAAADARQGRMEPAPASAFTTGARPFKRSKP